MANRPASEGQRLDMNVHRGTVESEDAVLDGKGRSPRLTTKGSPALFEEKPGIVFIVDDDKGLGRLIERALQREGFETATALSGNLAKDWLAKNHAGLMLLDLKLQDIEGKELIGQLTEAKHCPPFIIITGQGDERVAVEMMKIGAIDYLIKDVKFLEFVPAVVKRAFGQLNDQRRLKQLEKEILEISDRERQRLGQDLHDGLCQHLTGIELMSQVLEQKLAPKSKADAARVAEIAMHVREAISQTRLLARGLFPVTLESEGLESALEELSVNTEKMFGINCGLVFHGKIKITDVAGATHLYRIAQEAVSNAFKHGKAKDVTIEVDSGPERISLSIKDNGIGFSPKTVKNKGMGLRIMQYRAAMLGGILTIEPDEKGGMRVICSVPIRNAQ
jgi:signal transduction histidine kinase